MSLSKKFVLSTVTLAMLSVSLPTNMVQASAMSESNSGEESHSNTDIVDMPSNGLDSSTQVSDIDTYGLTQYVDVADNQFVLNIPDSVKVEEDLLSRASAELQASNALVKEHNLKINTSTLTATAKIQNGQLQNNDSQPGSISIMAYGKTGILKVRWNSVKVGLDAGLTHDVITAGAAGAAGYLGFIVSGPNAAAVVAAVSAVVGNHINIKDGVWFDFNVFTHKITHYGWQ